MASSIVYNMDCMRATGNVQMAANPPVREASGAIRMDIQPICKTGGQDSGYASRKRVEPYCRMGRGAGFRRGRAGQDLFRLGRKAICGVFRATENGGFVSADRGGNRSGNSAG